MIIVIVTASFFALIPLVLRTTRHWVHHSRLALLFICDKLLSRNVGELYSVTSRIIMLKVLFLAVVISCVSAKRKYNVRYKEVKNAEGLKSLMKGQENRFTTCEIAFFSEPVSHKHASKRCIRFFSDPG